MRLRVKQRENWEGAKGNLEESTVLFIYWGESWGGALHS